MNIKIGILNVPKHCHKHDLIHFVTVGIFIVPIDSGEKGSIAVTSFLSHGIFVTAIIDDLPHNSVYVSYFLIYIQLLLMFSVAIVLYYFIELWIYSVHADEAVLVCSSGRNKEKHTEKREG